MPIRQGEIYWMDAGTPKGSSIAYRHPFVVIQNNIFNKSRMSTTVVCALTSNLLKADIPGNILLENGEGNLTKQSVVNVSQIVTVDKSLLAERIGVLSKKRVCQILEGIQLLLLPKG